MSDDTRPAAAPSGEGDARLDWIELTGLRVFGRHGVLDEERRMGQPFIIDLALGLAAADRGDRLDRTVNYAEVAQQVHDVVAGEPVDLVETLAERVAAVCLTHRLVQRVRVAVHKPQAPIALPFDDVRVRIERQRGTA